MKTDEGVDEGMDEMWAKRPSAGILKLLKTDVVPVLPNQASCHQVLGVKAQLVPFL